ncbi:MULTISPECIES: fluoride efflux transporter FluC [Limosilactobacillus]|mgnify:CR=1 FL=1|jgi:CrcB protein|uniref:fluoride efflux transporter FluC n=1 Tax=Limosilactobacillus TaxID=2742598 RepID=UPI0024BAEF7C|nr:MULTISPECIES: CrcB family protein [Limosilactobacillus]MDM8332014.1 CrcB family protein [Limosilactobacillus pontis]
MLSVGCGSALGALLRYWLTTWWKRQQVDWPLATLLINLTGALVLGILTGRLAATGSAMLFWGVGLLGGYTTLSTLNTEMIAMVDEHRWGSLVIYFVVSYVGGLLAAWLGMSI